MDDDLPDEFHDRSSIATLQTISNEKDTTSQVLATGYITKRGRLVPTWNRRYFKLTASMLVYYADEHKAEKKGSFEFQRDTIVRDCTFRHFCFCLFQPGNDKRTDILYLSTRTMKEKDSWISVISSAISLLKASLKYAINDGGRLTTLTDCSDDFSSVGNIGEIHLTCLRARRLSGTSNSKCVVMKNVFRVL
jgi:hypothetical protein